MPILTKEQKDYIKEHSCESAFKMAHEFGCSVQTVYRWLHIFAGDSFLQAKYDRRKHNRDVVRELYPTHSASEIGRILGVTKASVNNIAKRIGVKHTEETSKRILHENVSRILTNEAKDNRLKSLARTIRLEQFRLMSGEPQQTKRRFKSVTGKQICTRSYLCRKYNYFYDKDVGDTLLIFFDNETKRLPAEREKYYNDKYGLKFEQADE